MMNKQGCERQRLSENAASRKARNHSSSGNRLQFEVETWIVRVKDVIDDKPNSDYIDIN
jgi:hypothetical protein